MKSRFVGPFMAATVLALLWIAEPAAAQKSEGSDALTQRAEIDRAVAAAIPAAAKKPTPRGADGHPVLAGYWAAPWTGSDTYAVKVSADGKTRTLDEIPIVALNDLAVKNGEARAANADKDPLRAPYKPEYVAKEKELARTAFRMDPGLHCYPLGVPRLGAPSEIVQTPAAFYFLYNGEYNEDMTHDHRVIPVGGQHADDKDRDPTPNGDSIAYWEGDTLVVDTVNIDPDTWLDGNGTFHDDNLHVVERFTRKGDTLQYDVTVEDPTLFTEPWRFISRRTGGRPGSTTRLLRPVNEHAGVPLPSGQKNIQEDLPCVERDQQHQDTLY
jgi:hypothetical protein